ncbi:YdcF family protein [Mucilaginibacter ginkgonis]|uniref:YdcF family protein n=1 Tax=Mucilaginibacter ginkgonis TaxID=2682091 RepID=A0A6I4I1J8_9SPHI|nr:YdcF family protein [Mucilaginibacter ginkgonis]QQL51364.1 YdcF family protein [Mucilaginibacter ginkgonis]
MQFILSKVLLPLLLPITWVLILALCALLAKNQKTKKRLLLSLVCVLIVFSIPFFIDTYARLWDYPQTQLPNNKKYSCVIVLGGYSGEKEDGTGFFDVAVDRLVESIELLNTNKASHILLTGGDGSLDSRGFSEANWVRGELAKLNVPDSLVLIEGKSKNTIENAQFTKKLLADNHLQPPYLLVTSAFHMRRADYVFKKAGLDVVPYPANYIAGISRTSYSSFIPSADALARWQLYTKEFVGLIVAKIRKF